MKSWMFFNSWAKPQTACALSVTRHWNLKAPSVRERRHHISLKCDKAPAPCYTWCYKTPAPCYTQCYKALVPCYTQCHMALAPCALSVTRHHVAMMVTRCRRLVALNATRRQCLITFEWYKAAATWYNWVIQGEGALLLLVLQGTGVLLH